MKNLRKRYKHLPSESVWEMIIEKGLMCIEPGNTVCKVGDIYKNVYFGESWVEIPNKEYNFEILYQKLCK